MGISWDPKKNTLCGVVTLTLTLIMDRQVEAIQQVVQEARQHLFYLHTMYVFDNGSSSGLFYV